MKFFSFVKLVSVVGVVCACGVVLPMEKKDKEVTSSPQEVDLKVLEQKKQQTKNSFAKNIQDLLNKQKDIENRCNMLHLDKTKDYRHFVGHWQYDSLLNAPSFSFLDYRERRADNQRARWGWITAGCAAATLLRAGWDVVHKRLSWKSFGLLGLTGLSAWRLWCIERTCGQRRGQNKNDLMVNKEKEKPETAYLSAYYKAYDDMNMFVLKNKCGEPERHVNVVQPSPQFTTDSVCWGMLYDIYSFRARLNRITTMKPLLQVMFGGRNYESKDNIALLQNLHSYDGAHMENYCDDNSKGTGSGDGTMVPTGQYIVETETWGERSNKVQKWYNKNGYEPIIDKKNQEIKIEKIEN